MAGQMFMAYAPNNRVSNAVDGAQVPAGEYYLGFRCTNAVEHCQLSFGLSARY